MHLISATKTSSLLKVGLRAGGTSLRTSLMWYLKMPKKDKKPVEFYTWLRSGLRKLSRRWSAIYEALDKAKVPYKGDNKRRKWSYVCAECDMLFESKQVAVDHKI